MTLSVAVAASGTTLAGRQGIVDLVPSSAYDQMTGPADVDVHIGTPLANGDRTP